MANGSANKVIPLGNLGKGAEMQTTLSSPRFRTQQEASDKELTELDITDNDVPFK